MLFGFDLLISSFFGYSIIRCFSSTGFDVLDQLASGIPLGLVVKAWIVFFVSTNSVLSPIHGIISDLIMITLIIIMKLKTRRNEQSQVTITKIVVVIGLTSWICFCFWSNAFINTFGFGGTVHPDIEFHLTLINSFAHGSNSFRRNLFDISSPILFNTTLTYPFIPDYHSAILVACFNGGIRSTYLVCSYLLSFSLVVSLYSLSIYIVNSEVISVLSTFLFFNAGGIGFIYFQKNCFSYDWVFHTPKRDLFWFHPLLHSVIPQPSSLWSLSINLWGYQFFMEGINQKRGLMLLAGIFAGLLPQIQGQAFIAFSLWSFFYSVFNFKFNLNYLSNLFLFGIPLLLLSIPQCLPFIRIVQGNGFFKFIRLWISLGFKDPITMWVSSLGSIFIIGFFLVWFFMNKKQIMGYIPSLLIFGIINLVSFQPWVMDNTKFLTCAWLPFTCVYVSNFLYNLVLSQKNHRHRQILTIVVVLLVLSMVFSSILCFIWSISNYKDINQYHENDFGEWLSENTPPTALFAFDPYSQTPPLVYSGRNSFLGPLGWVFSHGMKGDSYIEINEALLDFWYEYNTYEYYNISYVVDYLGNAKNFQPNDDNKLWDLVYFSPSIKAWGRKPI